MLGGEGGHVCFCPFLSVRFCPFLENRVPNGEGSTESLASASVLPRNGDFSSASVRRTIPRFVSASVKNRFEIPRPRRNLTILPRI